MIVSFLPLFICNLKKSSQEKKKQVNFSSGLYLYLSLSICSFQSCTLTPTPSVPLNFRPTSSAKQLQMMLHLLNLYVQLLICFCFLLICLSSLMLSSFIVNKLNYCKYYTDHILLLLHPGVIMWETGVKNSKQVWQNCLKGWVVPPPWK